MIGPLKMTRLDFFTMKSQFIMYLSLVLIILLFAYMGSSITILCITCSWFVALMSSNIFVIQEKNNLNRLYGSFAIRAKDIVLGRYLFVILNHLISIIIIIISYSVCAAFQNVTIEGQDILLGFSLSLLAFSAIVGIQLPLFFKMGYTKAKVWSIVPFIAVMALAVIPLSVNALSGVIEFMMSNESFLIICGILASCIIQFVSYHISVVAYCKGR